MFLEEMAFICETWGSSMEILKFILAGKQTIPNKLCLKHNALQAKCLHLISF